MEIDKSKLCIRPKNSKLSFRQKFSFFESIIFMQSLSACVCVYVEGVSEKPNNHKTTYNHKTEQRIRN